MFLRVGILSVRFTPTSDETVPRLPHNVRHNGSSFEETKSSEFVPVRCLGFAKLYALL